MNALILVDIQKDFLPGGSLKVPQGDEIISLVNDLQERFALVVATQDWHPPRHKSFASQHEGKEPLDTGTVGGHEQTLWPDHCLQGSAGAEFADELDMKKVEAIFRKGTNREFDSYSGFYDLGHEYNTGLAGYLKDKGLDRVFVCGLAADVCVKYTALDSIEEGFETFLIADATRAVEGDEGMIEALAEIDEAGGRIIDSEKIGDHELKAEFADQA